MLCGSLDGRGVWGRMDTCTCMTLFSQAIALNIPLKSLSSMSKFNFQSLSYLMSQQDLSQLTSLISNTLSCWLSFFFFFFWTSSQSPRYAVISLMALSLLVWLLLFLIIHFWTSSISSFRLQISINR